jgi:hypothetical protein
MEKINPRGRKLQGRKELGAPGQPGLHAALAQI